MGSSSRLVRRLLVFVWTAFLMSAVAAKADPMKTMVQDTLYRADGSVATGTVTIRWSGFSTSTGEAVPAGQLTMATDASGGISIPLIPNTGSSPAGSYYRVVIKLKDGTTSEEQWVVPAATTTTVSAIRAKVVPQAVAAQFVGRDYVDTAMSKLSTTTLVHLTGAETINGAKTFVNSPEVPAPVDAGAAANKGYVDQRVSGLASVAATGSYNDLSGTPAIPAEQVNADWNSTSGLSQVLNKPVLAAVATSGSYSDLSGKPAIPNLASPGSIGAVTPGSVNATAVTAQSVDGVLNAAQFAGADWAAKVTAAIGTLPGQGGTVFVPSSLSGGTSASGITLPAGVSIEFDAGTFTAGGPITLAGSGHSVRGMGRTATQLAFSGGTDGLVILDAGPVYKDTIIENLTLLSTNAAGSAAFRAADSTIAAPISVVMRNVTVTAGGAGKWAYGLFLANAQFMGFYDMLITGAVNVGIHGENSVNEDLFVNVFVMNTNGFRGAEFFPGAINSCEVYFVNGGIQGPFSGSALFNSGSYVSIFGMHFETQPVSGPSYSDGASIVVADGHLSATAAEMAMPILTTFTTTSPVVQISGSQLGDVTLSANTLGSIVSSNAKSITNNSSSVTLIGNTSWGGIALINTVTVGNLTMVPSSGTGQTIWSQGGVQSFAITRASGGSRFTLGSGFGVGFATSGVGSEDTYLSRDSLGAVRVGSTNGGTDGTFKAAKFYAGAATWTSGSGAPTGSCTNGSMYSRTDTGTVYVCQGAVWGGAQATSFAATTASIGGSALAVGCGAAGEGVEGRRFREVGEVSQGWRGFARLRARTS